MRFPHHKQLDSFDCGPACLQMVADFYGKKYSLDYLRDESFITREGVSLLGISQAAEKLGFRTLMVKITAESIREDCPLPVILHWNQDHFVVLYKIKRERLRGSGDRNAYRYLIADPAHELNYISESIFFKYWQTAENNKGIALLLEPTSAFFVRDEDTVKPLEIAGTIINYLRPFRKQILLLAICIILSILTTVSLPYFTKGLIDKGVIPKSHQLVLLIVASQLFLYISSSLLDIYRGWILLHMNSKISLHIISDFLKKLLKLPIRFFDSKSVGDVSQRISDHQRVESFLSHEVIGTLFSSLQMIIFSVILLFYRLDLWIVFNIFSFAGISWIFLFQKKRRQLDHIKFNQGRNTQEKLFELISGMHDIKLFGSEDYKRWEWEYLQLRQYKLNIKDLKLEQYQQTGFIMFSYSKNVLISYLTALSVMHGEMTLGLMLSISFIIGQTNGPLQQLVQFFKAAQNAKLSFSRLREVHHKPDEDTELKHYYQPSEDEVIHQDIILKNISFQYQGPRSPLVLDNINLTLRKGKITAIVGASGSGKTTLMKLLLNFYKPTNGTIEIGDIPLSHFYASWWRSQCGTVMQDGYIFNDSIAKNIVMDGSDIDMERFTAAINVSNTEEFVEQLPLKYNTKIGNSGLGLSGGQKQRILIARAIYKNPNFIFFDEATSSLDATNETEIMSQLDNFFIGKTVLIIAHRLSTVKLADQIIVLNKGQVVEVGNHLTLSSNKGVYYELVKNQLELGN